MDVLVPNHPAALAALNIMLHGLHSGLILFIMTGWIFPSARRLHLVFIGIVWFSWLAIGWYVGNLGYCALTDWQWRVKAAMGETDLPPSYIEYVMRQVTHTDIHDSFIHWVAASVLVTSTLLSLALNRRPRAA